MTSVAVGYAHKAMRGGIRLGRSILRARLERQARRLADEAIRRGGGLANVSEEEGFARYPAKELASVGAAFPSLLDLAEAWKDDESRRTNKMPINILKSNDLFEYRSLIDIALHDDIIAVVTSYIGQLPRLYNLNLWWTPPNQTQQGSQLYHYDHRDSRQAKLFLNVNDVTEASGPLHFLRASDSLKVDAKVGYRQGRYTDEEVYSAVPESRVLAATGESGTAYIVDTASCLHYGSRGNSRDRFVMMASFARVNSVSPGPGCEVLDPVRSRLARETYASDPVRSFVLDTPR
jgi:hypothetical protein